MSKRKSMKMPEISPLWSYAQSVRVRLGLKAAIKRGQKLGRPRKHDLKKVAEMIFPYFRVGLAYREIESLTGISKTVAQRAITSNLDYLMFLDKQDIQSVNLIKNELNKIIEEESK